MKKIMLVIAVMATIIASCSKSEPEAGQKNENEDGKIKIELSVGNLGSDDSKAYIKETWEDGDQLLIWFDTNTEAKPDLVIKYNSISKKWEQDGSAEVSGKKPGESGYMKVLYNNILAVTAKDSYKFAKNTLSGKIQNWTFLTEIQVVLYNINVDAADAGKYMLSCNKFTSYKGHIVGADAITAAPAGAAGSFVNGISNKDGLAFVYASSTAYDIETDLRFTLNEGDGTGDLPIITPTAPEYVEIAGLKWAKWNLGASKPEEYGYYFQWGDTGGSVYYKPLTYTAKTKTIAKKVTRIKGIKISRGNFGTLQNAEWINTKTGPIQMTWAYAPFNNGKTECDKTYFKSVIASVCPNNVLAPEYDAAHTYLGGKWRMPTSQEFTNLKNATYIGWDDTDKGFYVFDPAISGKTAGTHGTTKGLNKSTALLFFPAAGNGSQSGIASLGASSTYWSSSLFSTSDGFLQWASILNISKTAFSIPGLGNRCDGYPIRPVSD